MAIQELTASSLQLQFHVGIDPMSGNAQYKSKSFSNVNPEATAQALHTVALALESLQEHPLTGVNRRDNSEIRPQQ